MSSLSHIDILCVFLKHHNSYGAYVSNHNSTAHFYTNRPGALVNDMIVLCGFDWSKSLEGAHYWRTLNRKWYKLCTKFNLVNVEISYEQTTNLRADLLPLSQTSSSLQ